MKRDSFDESAAATECCDNGYPATIGPID